MNNTRQLDIHLLLTLQALLTEKHISKAAIKLFKSQPAVSHSLAELRKVFNDPLLIRQNGKLERTPRAEELLKPLTEILNQIQILLEPKQFDPSTAHRTFKMAMSDYGAHVVLPNLVQTLRLVAPDIQLQITQASRESMQLQVIEGELDFAFGVFRHEPPDDVCMATLFTEEFCCIADAKRYPHGLNLEEWLDCPHVLVAMHANSPNEIDMALAQKGLKRQIATTLTHWGIANELIQGTDLILTVAQRNIIQFINNPNYKIFEPPISLPSFDFKMIWHKRRGNDPAHIWLRQLILQEFVSQKY